MMRLAINKFKGHNDPFSHQIAINRPSLNNGMTLHVGGVFARSRKIKTGTEVEMEMEKVHPNRRNQSANKDKKRSAKVRLKKRALP